MEHLMTNKVVVITGATSGIGQSAAETLASTGAKIVQVARDRTRGEAALERLRRANPAAAHSIYYADLSSIGETERVGFEIADAEPHVHVLINNAGAIFSSYAETQEGLERTFALNHLAYFVLTDCLLDKLRASAPSRIVNTGSDAHESAMLDFDDLQSQKLYQDRSVRTLLRYGGPGFQAYARSKLCNLLFTRELARRLEGTEVTVNCVHPGFVATRFADEAGGFVSFGTRIAKWFARPIQKGAETLVYLASAPEASAITGEYFHDCHPVPTSPAARDAAAAQRLWEQTTKLVAGV